MNTTGIAVQVTAPPVVAPATSAAAPQAPAVKAPATKAPAAPTTAAAATATQQDAGSDFVSMLMELVGGSAPNAVSSPSVKLPATDVIATDDSDDAEALAAMLAMQMPVAPVVLPWAAQPAPTTDSGVDPLELLGLGKGTSKSVDALLGLQTDLTDAKDAPEVNGDSADGVGALSPFNETLSTRTTQAESTPARTLHSPVGSDRWANELGTRVTVMVEGGQQSASLKLSPEHLGPLEVRISVTDDKTSVWFGAAHADTRAAIENALPRLRDMFAAQGLSLGDTGVFREPPRDQAPASPRTAAGRGGEGGKQEGEVRISTRSIGLFDAYA